MPIRNGRTVQWKHTLRIKHLLSGDVSAESVRRVAQGVHEACKTNAFMSDWLHHDEIGEAENATDLNEMLADLYDYCDANLIWVE